MTVLIVSAVALGLLGGLTVLPPSLIPQLDHMCGIALIALVFLVGVSIGRNRDMPGLLVGAGAEMLLIPLSVALGSLLGSLAAGAILSVPHNEALAVGAGFGWYTLSGVLLTQLHSSALGAVAFLSNVMRELLTVILIPVLARRFGPLIAIAPGGATTMDTTLPIIAKCTDPRTTLVAFVNGVVLSTLVPVLVPLLLRS